MSRYARQEILPEIGAAGQARLALARVLVVGAGGLGSALLPLLAGAGVGQLTLVDPDRVEANNLHRQTLYRMADIAEAKAVAAARALVALNPDCRVVPRVARLDPQLARSLVPDADVVVDAADSFAVTYALSDLCLAAGKPMISASVMGRQGYVGGFCGTAPSCRAVFPDLPSVVASCVTGGVMGPVVATLGALQAQMALAVILGHAPSPLGQVLALDLAAWRFSAFRFDTAPEPQTALPAVLSISELRLDDVLIDLRQPEEAPLILPWAERKPPTDIPRDRRVVFACTTGLRAWRAASRLIAEGYVNVAIVTS